MVTQSVAKKVNFQTVAQKHSGVTRSTVARLIYLSSIGYDFFQFCSVLYQSKLKILSTLFTSFKTI